MTQKDLVSILIPAYNAEKFIGETLESALLQTYSDIEIIVIDDGSTDRTPDVVGSYAERDSRIRLLRQENSGVSAARNRGISEARGEFVAPLDADDLWDPTKIEKQVARLRELGPETAATYTWCIFIDEDGRPTGGSAEPLIEGDVFLALFCHNFTSSGSNALFRKACFDIAGNYRGALTVEDLSVLIRVAERFAIGVVPEYLVAYRQVRTSLSRHPDLIVRGTNDLISEVCRRHPQIPGRVRGWSRAFSYLHASARAAQSGDLVKAVRLSLIAICFDPVRFLRSPGDLFGRLTRVMTRRLRLGRGQESPNLPKVKAGNLLSVANTMTFASVDHHGEFTQARLAYLRSLEIETRSPLWLSEIPWR